MELLAQAEAVLNPGWQTLLLGYGPLGAIALIVLWVVIKYLPRILESHITLADTCRTTQVRIADALETISETHTLSGQHHTKTHRALGHAFHAAKEVVTCPDAHKHLDKAIDELSR